MVISETSASECEQVKQVVHHTVLTRHVTTLLTASYILFIQFNSRHNAHEVEKERNKNKIEI